MRRQRLVEFQRVERHRPAVPEAEIAEMQIAMGAADEARRLRGGAARASMAARAARTASCQADTPVLRQAGGAGGVGVAVGDGRHRGDRIDIRDAVRRPRDDRRRRHRRAPSSSAGVQHAGGGPRVEEIARRHARHAQHPVDRRRRRAAKRQRAIRAARTPATTSRYRPGAAGRVQRQFALGEAAAGLERGKIQERQAHRLLELPDRVRAAEDERDMRLDRRRTREPAQQGNGFGLLRRDSPHRKLRETACPCVQPRALAHEDAAVVQPEGHVLPELEAVGHHAVAGPVRRAGNRPRPGSVFRIRRAGAPASARLGERARLVGRPGAEPGNARAGGEIGVGLGVRHWLDAALDADLRGPATSSETAGRTPALAASSSPLRLCLLV